MGGSSRNIYKISDGTAYIMYLYRVSVIFSNVVLRSTSSPWRINLPKIPVVSILFYHVVSCYMYIDSLVCKNRGARETGRFLVN